MALDERSNITLAGAWAGGTEYGVNVVFLNKIVCFVLRVTSFLFVIFLVDLEFSHTLCHFICICVVSVLCHIVLICVELKFITHARIEVYHTSTQNAYFTLVLL